MVKLCYGIITFWMCNFNLVLKRFLFNGDTWTLYGKNTGKGIKVYFYGETTSPKGNVNYNGHQWIIYDINDKLGVKLAGDQNIPADVFPMTVNIAAYQA